MAKRFSILAFIATLATLAFAQPRVQTDIPGDDFGRYPTPQALNNIANGQGGRAVLYPESLAGGGSVIDPGYTLINSWTTPTVASTGGTWVGYTSAGVAGGATAPTITLDANARFGSATTLITWDPTAAGENGQYVEWTPPSANPLAQGLRWNYFASFWIQNDATTASTDIDVSLYDTSNVLIYTFDVTAIATADVWIKEELDLRIPAIRSKLALAAKIRITHATSGTGSDVMRVQEFDAYKLSYGKGPVRGTVLVQTADAAMARGSLVAAVTGSDGSVTAATSNTQKCLGYVVEGASINILEDAQILAPTAAGDPVYIYVLGPALGRVAVVTPAIGDPVAVVSATTVDNDNALGRGFGTWKEVGAADGDYGFNIAGLAGAGSGSLPPNDSLDYAQFVDAMTLDASTTVTGTSAFDFGFVAVDGNDDAWSLIDGSRRWIDLDLNATDILRLTQTAGTDIAIGNTTGDITMLSDNWTWAPTINLPGPTGITGTAGEPLTFTRAFTNDTSEVGLSLLVTASDTGSGTTAQRAFRIRNEESTEGADALLFLDTNDADVADAVGAAILIANTGGGGYTSFLDTPSIDIDGAGAITGATGIVSTGTAAFATLTASGTSALTGAATLLASDATAGTAALRFGATVTEGYEIRVYDEVISPAAISTAILTLPAGHRIISIQGNVDAALTGGGTTTDWAIGIALDPDQYVAAKALTHNTKADVVLQASTGVRFVWQASSADVTLEGVTGAGAAGDTALTAGSVRVRIVYEFLNSLDDTP